MDLSKLFLIWWNEIDVNVNNYDIVNYFEVVTMDELLGPSMENSLIEAMSNDK